MTLRRASVALLTALALITPALAAAPAAAAPAALPDSLQAAPAAVQAHARMNPCARNYLCLYDYWSTGTVIERVFVITQMTQGTCYAVGNSINNKTSYIWNNSVASHKVYTGGPTGTEQNCGGSVGDIHPDSSGNMGYPFNNSIGAVKKWGL